MRSRIRKQPSPCLATALIMEMVRAQNTGAALRANLESLPATLDDLRRNGPRDRLLEHFAAFLIGACNSVAIDFVHGPGVSWSLMVIGGWAGLLVVHALALGVVGKVSGKAPTAQRISAATRAGRRLLQFS